MKTLFKLALQNREHRFLIALTIVSMILLTFASQLEVLTLGVITKSGPSFFEVLAPEKDGVLQPGSQVSLLDYESRWNELDPQHTGVITETDVSRFLGQKKEISIFQRAMDGVNAVFPVYGNAKNLALLIVVIAFFKAIMLFSQRYAARLVAIRVSRDLRQYYFEHIQSLPMEFFQQFHSGSLSSRAVGDAAMIAESINACLVNYIQTPFVVASSLVYCFILSWKLSLMIFFGFPCIVYPIIYLSKQVKRISREIQKNQESFASVLIDFLAGVQTIKIFAMEDYSLKKYQEQNRRMAQLEEKSARYDLSSRPIVHTIAMLFLGAAMLYGLYGLEMSISEVFIYCGFLFLFYEPVKKFAEENSHIQRGIAAAERMIEVTSIKPCISDVSDAESLTKINGKIEFDRVWFRYEADWVLKDLSFTIEPGQTVAIVGPTGAGKSTIVNLLPRLYDVQKGEIRINGKPLTSFTQQSIREHIAFVPQKPFLFLDTISENISFGRSYSSNHVEAAARMAHAEEFIVKLPLGYQTVLSESGKNLSGGQQQRLAIARALAKDASLLVMDEATSSLDNVSEQNIKMTIQNLKGKITQIIIAHRLTTIEGADKIVYIEHGVKKGEGTKEELLASCPGFRLMWATMNFKENTFVHE